MVRVSKTKKPKVKKLSQKPSYASHNRRGVEVPVRKLAPGHIQEHKRDGYRYYTYRRGTDKEIYLGTADAILKAVKGGDAFS